MSDHDDYEPHHESSPTEHLIQDLQLHGYRPSEDERDHRPAPEARIIEGAVADIFDALVATLGDTRLEPDLEELLWGTVNLFHRAASRVERDLDDNEQAQRRSQQEQDGTEVKAKNFVDAWNYAAARANGQYRSRDFAPILGYEAMQLAATEPGAATQLAGLQVLDAIAEKEEVEVSQQELIEYLVMTAQQYGMDPSTFAKAMDDGDQVGAMVNLVSLRVPPGASTWSRPRSCRTCEPSSRPGRTGGYR